MQSAAAMGQGRSWLSIGRAAGADVVQSRQRNGSRFFAVIESITGAPPLRSMDAAVHCSTVAPPLTCVSLTTALQVLASTRVTGTLLQSKGSVTPLPLEWLQTSPRSTPSSVAMSTTRWIRLA